MPRSRNTRIRPKNTSRAEARRRHREDQRATDAEPEIGADDAAEAQAAAGAQRPAIALPNVVEDVRALPQVFRRRLVWLPFGLLALTFVLAVALVNGALDDAPPIILDATTLYVSLTLHPTTLFIFFIGGFLAPRASYLVGAMLGVLSSLAYLGVVTIATEAARDASLEAITATTDGSVPSVTTDLALQTIGLGLVVGTLAGGFASWYRRFLRSSQERARLNRMQREQEQARKAKEQARQDKQAAREARRRRTTSA